MMRASFDWLTIDSSVGLGGAPMIGDWMGSQYTSTGRRWDLYLFLDHNGKYERTIRVEPNYERQDVG